MRKTLAALVALALTAPTAHAQWQSTTNFAYFSDLSRHVANVAVHQQADGGWLAKANFSDWWFWSGVLTNGVITNGAHSVTFAGQYGYGPGQDRYPWQWAVPVGWLPTSISYVLHYDATQQGSPDVPTGERVEIALDYRGQWTPLPAVVAPEPSTLILLASGAGAIALLRRRRTLPR